ncbi:MAG: hypothetical protein HY558_05295 [Euryarchaeota archaeon]|nr:hypothetical protein [Euryarchaeota archaeon]
MVEPMRFTLHGALTASGDLPGAQGAIEALAGEMNRAWARQAKPGEATTLRVESIQGRELRVSVDSWGLPRAHDALLQFKNKLAESLGKSHRIGIREVRAEPGYTILLEKAQLAPGERQPPGPGEARTITRADKPIAVVFGLLTEADIKSRLADRLLKQLQPTQPPPAGVPFGHILRKTGEKKPQTQEEVAQALEKRGWVKRFPGRAQWILLPPAARLLYTLRDLAIEKVLAPLGFEEAMFPKLIHFDVMQNMPGYFEHLAEGMFYVTSPPRDPKALEEFKRDATLKKQIRGDLLRQALPEPEYVLAPAQCEPFYTLYSQETVRHEDLPIKLYDASGWTWRSEGGGVEGLVRTTEFWRMESVWLGTPEQALETRDKIADKVYDLVDKTLGLETRMVVGAPFYATPETAQAERIDATASVNIPTLDIEVWLPYRGPRDTSEWLEIGAYTCAKTKYIKSFHIKEAKNRDIWTGCGGFGLTRWLAGFLAQQGFEFDGWPEEVKRRMKKLPGVPKAMTWP